MYIPLTYPKRSVMYIISRDAIRRDVGWNRVQYSKAIEAKLSVFQRQSLCLMM
ncbi:hypothetical protein J2Z75_003770 [Rhizobium herbae]|uniref:Uncharacterized protein n=1 Tax=Rhizobium herbae TaxID=508661 RepID=A0ABS4EQM6_9HYPH|nr:hypothetical protein [Rhizobium herbae]